MLDPTLIYIKASVKVNSKIEIDQLMTYLKKSARQLTDDGTDVLVKREIMKIITTLATKLFSFKKSATISINWFEYNALQYVFNQFEVQNDLILALVLFGKISQSLPAGLGVTNS